MVRRFPARFSRAPQEKFDVASLKELPTDRFIGNEPPLRITPTSLSDSGTLAMFIGHAYSLQPGMLKDLPPETRRIGYTLNATTDLAKSKDAILMMYRSLLAERFGLKTHRETRELSYMAMVAGQARNKLKPRDPDEKEPEPVKQVFHFRTPKEVADMVAAWTGTPVTDETGISGDLKMTLDVRNARPSDYAEGPLRGPDALFAMRQMMIHEIEQQFGFKLERRKGPIEVLVVDHAAARPTQN